MNNYPFFLGPPPEDLNSINSQIDSIRQEIKILNRRLLALEKNNIENKSIYGIIPTPLTQNKIEAMNNSYSKDNYII